MRITDGMIAANTLRNINKAANRLAAANAAVSSNKKIQMASDDPVVASRAVTYRNYVSQIKQYQDNVDAADGWQKATDSALSDMSDLITTLKTLTTQASSDTCSEDDLTAIKARVETLRDQAVTIMNTTYAGRYIFGGYSTNEAPYKMESTDIGDTVTYKGDYLSLGSVVSSQIDDADIEAFYTQNTGSVYNSLAAAAASAQSVYTSAQAAADANPADMALAAKALAAKNTADTLVAAVSTYGGLTNLTDAAASAQSAYTTAKAAAVADPSDTALAAAAAAAKNTSDTLAATIAGSGQNINYKIGFSNDVTVNIEGQEVTGEGSNNLFNTISKLLLALDGDISYKTTKLDASGNVTVKTESLSLSGIIDELSSDLNQVTVAQAKLGARMDTVQTASNSLGDAYTSYSTLMSNNENIDTATAATELTSAEYTYQAALSVGSKVISKTLIDYIT